MTRAAVLLAGLLILGCDRGADAPTYEGKTLAEWQPLLRDKDAVTQRGAVRAVAALSQDDPAAADALWGMVADARGHIRLEVVSALRSTDAGEARSAELVAALRDELKDESSDVRKDAAFSLGFFRDKAAAAVPDLEKLAATDPDAGVRMTADHALSYIRKATTKPAA